MTKPILIIVLISTFFLVSTSVYAKRLHKEKEYQASWCAKANGITEYVLPAE